jgi:hypothetical protein
VLNDGDVRPALRGTCGAVRRPERYATHLASLCPVVTGLRGIVDNLAEAVHKYRGLWTTCHKMVVNVHPHGAQRVSQAGWQWGLSQVPKEPPVDVLTGFLPCPHRNPRAAMWESGVIHTIHTPYNGNEFSYLKRYVRTGPGTDRQAVTHHHDAGALSPTKVRG